MMWTLRLFAKSKSTTHNNPATNAWPLVTYRLLTAYLPSTYRLLIPFWLDGDAKSQSAALT